MIALTSLLQTFLVMGGFGAVLIIAGAAGLYFWNLSKAANNLQYYPGSITGFELFPPTVYVSLIVQNTSNVSFTINSLSASVLSDGTLIGNVSDFTPVAIAANSEGSLPLKLTLMPIGLANDIISIVSGNAGSRTILVQGSVNANGMQQAISLSFKVGL